MKGKTTTLFEDLTARGAVNPHTHNWVTRHVEEAAQSKNKRKTPRPPMWRPGGHFYSGRVFRNFFSSWGRSRPRVPPGFMV